MDVFGIEVSKSYSMPDWREVNIYIHTHTHTYIYIYIYIYIGLTRYIERERDRERVRLSLELEPRLRESARAVKGLGFTLTSRRRGSNSSYPESASAVKG